MYQASLSPRGVKQRGNYFLAIVSAWNFRLERIVISMDLFGLNSAISKMGQVLRSGLLLPFDFPSFLDTTTYGHICRQSLGVALFYKRNHGYPVDSHTLCQRGTCACFLYIHRYLQKIFHCSEDALRIVLITAHLEELAHGTKNFLCICALTIKGARKALLLMVIT